MYTSEGVTAATLPQHFEDWMATLQPFQLIGQSPGQLFILWKIIGATLPQHFEDWMATLQPFQLIGQSPDPYSTVSTQSVLKDS